MRLRKYKAMRDFFFSPEPKPQLKKGKEKKKIFVIQKHAASHLHYDFRLEEHGVLVSWAIPKGPSLDPSVKRLAMHVEDHPYDYKDFEGIIPSGYGAGSVIVWDNGTYEGDVDEGLREGKINITLHGEKINGSYSLVRMRANQWLLIKAKDKFASKKEITKEDKSVLSGKTLEELGGGRKSKKPHLVKPMLCKLIDAPFDDEEWIFEIKWDGYRAMAEISPKKVELYSRNFLSFNDQFSIIVDELKKLKIDAIFDGEIVALDSKGKAHFQDLQNRNPKNLVYYVFDLLYLKGRDLRDLPLLDRKELLQALLGKSSRIRYQDHVEEKGIKFYNLCKKSGLEGIVGKKKESTYQEGKRTGNWVKVKIKNRLEAVICGFTEPRKSRKEFGALILGVYKNGKLTYIGHVGTGFSDRTLTEMKKKMKPLIQEKSPFKVAPKTNTKVTWVKPKLVCEIDFQEMTSEGIMRQPVFLGLRKDKSAKEVVGQ